MRRLIQFFRHWLSAAEVDEPAETGDEADAGSRSPDHDELIRDAVRRAIDDAIRHEEDLLDQQLPMVEESEAICVARLSSLRSRSVTRQRDLCVDLERAEATTADAQVTLAAVDAALRAAGVPADQVALPARSPGGLLGRLRSLLAPSEPAATVRLRQLRAAAAADLQTSTCEEAAVRGQLGDLPLQTREQACREAHLAIRLVRAYRSAVFSALPPGVLASGRAFADQREPEVELPDWVPANTTRADPDNQPPVSFNSRRGAPA